MSTVHKPILKLMQKNGDILVITKDNKLDTLPNTPYNLLKVEVFEGKQISYTFNDKIDVKETFDDGIFNCMLDGESLQCRKANRMARAITTHQETGDLKPVQSLFIDELKAPYQVKAVNEFLKPFMTSKRVVTHDKGYIIDERFYIDNNAKVYILKNNEWAGICVVVKNTLIPFEIDTPVGSFQVESRAIEVLSKIIFLLKPDMNDTVFVEQLTTDVREQLMRDYPPPPLPCERTTNVIKDMEFQICEGVMDTEDAVSGFKVCSHCKYPTKDNEVKHYEALKIHDKIDTDNSLDKFTEKDDTANRDTN